MAGTAITSVTSEQWKLQHSGNIVLGNYGIQMIGDRYCAAIGSRFTTKIATKFDVVLEFVVGPNNTLDPFAKKMGDFNVIFEFEGSVTEIRVYE